MPVFGHVLVLPVAIVGKEIAEVPGLGVKGVPEECHVAHLEIGQRQRPVTGSLFQQDGQNHGPCVVIGGVPMVVVRDDEGRMLENAGVVRHLFQVS